MQYNLYPRSRYDLMLNISSTSLSLTQFVKVIIAVCKFNYVKVNSSQLPEMGKINSSQMSKIEVPVHESAVHDRVG